MSWPSFCPEPCAAVAYHRDATNAAALAGGRHRRSGPFGGMNKLDAAQARYGKRMSLRPPPAAQPALQRRVRQRSSGEVCGAIPHRVGGVDRLPLRIAPLAPGSSWTRYPSVAAEGLTCDRSQPYDRDHIAESWCFDPAVRSHGGNKEQSHVDISSRYITANHCSPGYHSYWR